MRRVMHSTKASVTPSAATSRTTPRLRLDVLDGIRGLSAVYVALFHALGYAGHTQTPQTELSGLMAFVGAALNYGSYAVPVFIVLSGFCLMLPLAQRNSQTMPGSVVDYIRRRAWRSAGVVRDRSGCDASPAPSQRRSVHDFAN